MLLEELDLELRKAALELQAAIVNKLPMLNVKLKYEADGDKLDVPSYSKCSHGIVLKLEMGPHDNGLVLLGRLEQAPGAIAVFIDYRGEDDLSLFFRNYAKEKHEVLQKILATYIVFPTTDGIYDVKKMLKVDVHDMFVEYDGEVYKPKKLTNYKNLKQGDVVSCFISSSTSADIITVTSYVDRDSDDDPEGFLSYADVAGAEAIRVMGVNKNDNTTVRFVVTAQGLREISHQKTISKSLLFTKV
jgi:hypothetical protein